MRWAKVLSAAAFLIVLAGCSGSSSASAPREGGAASDRDRGWSKIREAPCSLMTAKMVAQAVDGAHPREIDAEPGSCRYDLGEGVTAQLDVYRPLTDQGLADRSAGTAEVEGGSSLRLDTPGSAMLVTRGNGAVLVALRSATPVDASLQEDVANLAAAVRKRLPAAPEAAEEGLSDQDLCAVVPASLVGEGFTAGDGQDPDTCAYRNESGTQIRIRLRKGTTQPGPASESWGPGGKGATWQATGSGDALPSGVPPVNGGAGLGLVPVKAGTVEITISSPRLPPDEIEAIAADVAERVQLIDRN